MTSWISAIASGTRISQQPTDAPSGIEEDRHADKRLLIIDDEDDIREVASLSLEMTEGWKVTTANCGASGVEVARSTPFDAILLDVMMPDMDGPSTLLAIRALGGMKAVPVIFLTAKVQAADRRKLLELGVEGVIAKPFDPLTLGRQICETLGWLGSDAVAAAQGGAKNAA